MATQLICKACQQSLCASSEKSETSENNKTLCVVCLGLAAEDFADTAAEQIVETLKSGEFKVEDSVGVEIVLPPSLLLWSELLKLACTAPSSSTSPDTINMEGSSNLILDSKAWALFDVGSVFKSKVRNALKCKLKDSVKLDAQAPISATLSVLHPASDTAARDLMLQEKLVQSRKRKRGEADVLSRGRITELVGRFRKHTAENILKLIPRTFGEVCAFKVTLSRAPIYIQGRYRKLSRGVSQTPWLLKQEPGPSVETLIAPYIKTLVDAEEHKFHSAGREDIDVRMLGDGRPFVVQLNNAKRLPTKEELEVIQKDKINSDPEGQVEVLDLELTDANCMERLRQGALSKKKQYTCVIWTSKSLQPKDLMVLNSVKDMTVVQRTPIRVLHRRSALDRDKMVHSCECEYINSHFFILRLVASAGTYIKEFVHGDFGRTMPNVGSLLGCEADILQLDVEKLIYDQEATTGEISSSTTRTAKDEQA
mmetsp:Transcript_9875/g.19390  ORF Transcript_9875/g.19390 Transcript_9875/m.19390 type:complete len:482 (+) Transcript_9875:75-1520(+)